MSFQTGFCKYWQRLNWLLVDSFVPPKSLTQRVSSADAKQHRTMGGFQLRFSIVLLACLFDWAVTLLLTSLKMELSNQLCLIAFVIKNYWISNLMASSLGNSRSVERVEISSRVPWQTVQRVHQRLGPSGMSRVSNATISWRKTVSPRPFRSAALLLNIAQTIVHLTIYHVKKWLKFQFFCFQK